MKDVGEGDCKALRIGHRTRIGLIKVVVAIELQFVERMGNPGSGVGGFIRVVVGWIVTSFLPPGHNSSSRHPAWPSWAAKAVTGPLFAIAVYCQIERRP